MRKYNISSNLVGTIEQLYAKALSAVQMNSSMVVVVFYVHEKNQWSWRDGHLT